MVVVVAAASGRCADAAVLRAVRRLVGPLRLPSLGELLPDWIDVYVVELPGHPVRSSEPLFRRMAPLIAAAGLRSSPRALAEYLPIIRADTELLCTYAAVPRPPLAMPIVAFTGSTDSLTPLAGVQAWREQTRGDFTVETFDGGHFFIQGASGEMLRDRIVVHLAHLTDSRRT